MKLPNVEQAVVTEPKITEYLLNETHLSNQGKAAVFFMLHDAFTEQVTPHQERTGIPRINRSQLSSTHIPLPPLDEQVEIATILNAADAKLAAAEERCESLRALFQSTLHELMTGQRRLLSDEGLPLSGV